MQTITKVALDAMGGDNAPVEIVKGAVDAVLSRDDIKVFLVGQEDAVRDELNKYEYPKEQIEIVKLEPGAVSAYDDYSSQRVDMNVHGNFFQLMYFLKDMENSRMFIHVEKVSISNKKEGLDCRLGVRIFSEAS